ncbi:putative lipid II flippase FtsW [Arthrobacter zhaoguopingii]|uniref:putative lipid II flippase FtsW n=1 Tax=Arthrobacter zhaoguopingii TaxID=2681491 RepID=UPI001357459D|nr:putative lipid II flippase FtsW [Arthrobacter zhaoguopingii]
MTAVRPLPRPTTSPSIDAPRRSRLAPVFSRLVRLFSPRGPGSARSASTLLLATTFSLVGIGLIMVLSASSFALAAQGQSPYGTFLRQGLWCALGLIALLVFARIPLRLYRRLSRVALLGSFALAVLVFTPLGVEVNGNRNWIAIGSMTIQPSEFLKFSLILWGAGVLTDRVNLERNPRHGVVPVLLASGIALCLVLAGRDLGTALILAPVVGGLFFFTGARLRSLMLGAGVVVIAVIIAVLSSPNRLKRILVWLDPSGAGAAEGLGYQGTHAVYALAGGGVFGVGLGQSRQKVHWIPEAHNDFIFAVLGEELGLAGATLVLILFATLAVAIVRIARLAGNPYAICLCGSALVWVLGQAVVNIAVVTGLIPVVGIPLPFISYGGSSIIALLALVGVLLSCLRTSGTTRDAVGSG